MDDKQTFERLSSLIGQLNTTNSSNEKKEILKNYEDLKTILRYVYDPFKQYGITSKYVTKMHDLQGPSKEYDALYQMLDDLNSRAITGHDAIRSIHRFIEKWGDYKDLILAILDRSLKTRVDAKLINNVFPNCIPSFSVALAEKYQDVSGKINWNDGYYASRKLDGIRLVTIIQNDTIEFVSRKGKEFYTLEKLREPIKNLNLDNIVLDGEVCIIDENGNENFTSIVSFIKRKDFTIEKPRYKVFDILTTDEFFSQTSKRKFSERLTQLYSISFDGNFVTPVLQNLIKNEKQFESLFQEAKDNNWEGLMLRKDVEYKGKRSKDLLKVKAFFDDTYKVKNITFGPIRFINKETGLEDEEEMLSAVTVLHKGFEVSVGSGFSLEQRKYYYKHAEEIMGRDIEVVYFEETKNKHGGISLRFPTCKHIYDKGGRKT